MKSLSTLWLLLCASAMAGPTNSETVIRFTLVSHVREGLVFSKRTIDDIPVFAVGEFAGDEAYALSLLKKNEFDAALSQIEKAFNESAWRPGCGRRIVRELVSRGKVAKKDSVCLDAAAAKAYEGARGFLK